MFVSCLIKFSIMTNEQLGWLDRNLVFPWIKMGTDIMYSCVNKSFYILCVKYLNARCKKSQKYEQMLSFTLLFQGYVNYQ